MLDVPPKHLTLDMDAVDDSTNGAKATVAFSARVLEKCGFQEEGYLRKHYLKDDKVIDARLFALLR